MTNAKKSGAIRAKRGRPSAERIAAIDMAIREAAMAAFLADGFEGTAMEAVAQSAGVPKTTLYKRFPDKRALLRAVLTERVSSWCLSHPAQAPGTDLSGRLKSLAAGILQQATTSEIQAFWSLASAAWSSPGEAQERNDAIGYSRIIDNIEQEIRDHGPASGINARDPRAVATTLMAMLGGWIEYVAPTVTDPAQASADFSETAIDLLMQGSSAW